MRQGRRPQASADSVRCGAGAGTSPAETRRIRSSRTKRQLQPGTLCHAWMRRALCGLLILAALLHTRPAAALQDEEADTFISDTERFPGWKVGAVRRHVSAHGSSDDATDAPSDLP